MRLEAVSPDTAYAVAAEMRERDREEFAAVLPCGDRASIAAHLRGVYGRRTGVLCARCPAGVPVCIGGAVAVRPGVATLLFYATDAFPGLALSMTRFIRRHYFPSLAATGIHRIECVSLAAYGEMHRWLETLGLRQEGVFQAYGKGREDFVQYAWVSDVRPTGP